MPTTTDGHKVGTVEYLATIDIDDGAYINTADSRTFNTACKAEAWAMARIRYCQLTDKHNVYAARVERRRWVADVYSDTNYGTVHDGVAEYDVKYQSYFDGVTWNDNHSIGERWER